jgi:hypothetical protein
MKKLTVFLLIIALVCCLCACAESAQKPSQTDAPTSPTQTPTKGTEPTQTQPEDDGTVTYTVKIVDENNKAIPNVLVQLCKDSCVPNKTNEEGIATYKLPEDAYKASIMSMPEGYAHTSDKTEFYFEDGSYELTITLKAA